MTENGKKKIILTAGGSGGHVFPAEALAKELIERGHIVSFITDKRGNTFSGQFPLTSEFHVFAAGYAGKGFIMKIWSLFLLGLGVLQSLWILKKQKPDAVIGFGGYASFPACYAATLLKIPVILHEQNAVLGGANRILAQKSSLIATTFPSVQKIPVTVKKVYTGMPIRPEILALEALPYPDPVPPFQILITGGSQGAKIFSRIVPDALKALPETLKTEIKITQQARPEDMPKVAQAYENSGLDVELATFFSDMPGRLNTAHLVICRAGASTISELTVAGRPAIIVPFLNAADKHQQANARSLAETEGVWVKEEPDFTSQWLTFKIQELFNNPKMLITAAENVKSRKKTDAVSLLADAVLQIAGD